MNSLYTSSHELNHPNNLTPIASQHVYIMAVHVHTLYYMCTTHVHSRHTCSVLCDTYTQIVMPSLISSQVTGNGEAPSINN